MSDSSTIFIAETQTLEDLMMRLEYGADTMLSVRDAISNYLAGVVAVMQNMEQRAASLLETAKASLQEAEANLATAENVLEECQMYDDNDYGVYYDDDGDCYDDDCYDDDDDGGYEEAEEAVNAAREAVAAAQQEVERREKNWIRAGHIVTECKDARMAWLVSVNPGCESGDAYLKNLGEKTLNDAKQRMLRIQEVVEKILSVQFSENKPVESFSPVSESPLSERAESRLREQSIDDIREKQVSGARYYGQADATHIVKCPKCGRPPLGCICHLVHKS